MLTAESFPLKETEILAQLTACIYLARLSEIRNEGWKHISQPYPPTMPLHSPWSTHGIIQAESHGTRGAPDMLHCCWALWTTWKHRSNGYASGQRNNKTLGFLEETVQSRPLSYILKWDRGLSSSWAQVSPLAHLQWAELLAERGKALNSEHKYRFKTGMQS